MAMRLMLVGQAEAESHKQQVQALTKQLEDLMASKTRLESRCQLLEKVVSLREGTGDLALLVRNDGNYSGLFKSRFQ